MLLSPCCSLIFRAVSSSSHASLSSVGSSSSSPGFSPSAPSQSLLAPSCCSRSSLADLCSSCCCFFGACALVSNAWLSARIFWSSASPFFRNGSASEGASSPSSSLRMRRHSPSDSIAPSYSPPGNDWFQSLADQGLNSRLNRREGMRYPHVRALRYRCSEAPLRFHVWSHSLQGRRHRQPLWSVKDTYGRLLRVGERAVVRA